MKYKIMKLSLVAQLVDEALDCNELEDEDYAVRNHKNPIPQIAHVLDTDPELRQTRDSLLGYAKGVVFGLGINIPDTETAIIIMGRYGMKTYIREEIKKLEVRELEPV